MAEIYITRSGADVNGARVYLFNQSGSYLSRYETTDATGKVYFRLPSRTYKFRADEGGDQAWSSEIQITAGIVNNVSIDFFPVSVIISADPETIHVGQTSTLTWSSTNADNAEIDQGIGSVAVSGSTVVTPAETTTYTITVTGTQGSAVASTTVTVTNNPPVAVDDLVSTDEDTPITAIAVLVNDSDPDGDTVSISDFTQPSHGTSGSNGDGTLTYTPDADFNGNDSFTYTITDGTSESPPATVTITINPVNDPPVANAGTDQSVNGGEMVNLDGALSSDVDGNVLTYQWAFVSLPSGSSAALSDSAAANPTFTADLAGTYEVQLVVNDGMVDSQPDAVTITATVTVNYPPTITVLEPDGVDDTGDHTYTIRWNDADPDNNASISLYYDTDNSGTDGTLIATMYNEYLAINEDPDGGEADEYVWDTKRVPEGTYYVYAQIYDGVNAPVVDYSNSPVSISHWLPLLKGVGLLRAQLNESGFGSSVDISGDYAIVGVPRADTDGLYSSGAAYIYKREIDGWMQQEKLVPNDIVSQMNFGLSVAISGNCAIVGSRNIDISTGAAYIFEREGDAWSQQKKLVAEVVGDYSYGQSVSINGDYIIVGSASAPAGNNQPGAAYVFKQEEDNWALQAKLSVSDHPKDQSFGKSVKIYDNYAIIGATDYAEDPVHTGAYTGCAFIFKRTGSIWIEQAKLIAGDGSFDHSFGGSVAICGEYAIVGQPDAEDGLGAAHIYKNDNTSWTQQVRLVGDDDNFYTSFGYSVALHEGHAVVGAPFAEPLNGSEPLPGAAYLFMLGENGWQIQEKVYGTYAGIDEPGSMFGASVAIDGAYIIIGAPYMKIGTVGAARIYFNGDTIVKMHAAPLEIVIGQSATLSWTSVNANTVTIDQGIGNVDDNGSITVTPGQTTTYSITATGAARINYDHVTINVIDTAIPPVVSFNALENRIDPGDSTTLWWNTVYTDSCNIAPGIGNVDLNDSITVSPNETTIYTISATGPGGTTTETVTITVAFQPTVNITANPVTILYGGSSTLAWSSTYADSVIIEPDIGSVNFDGSLDVSPIETTTYTITATGPGGTSSDSTTVQVLCPQPGATLTAMPNAITEGESSTLTWNTTYADSVTIEPDVGSVGLSGSVSVSPTSTTDYTLTATGPCGSTQRSVTVTVRKQPGIYYEYDALGRIIKIMRIPK